MKAVGIHSIWFTKCVNGSSLIGSFFHRCYCYLFTNNYLKFDPYLGTTDQLTGLIEALKLWLVSVFEMNGSELTYKDFARNISYRAQEWSSKNRLPSSINWAHSINAEEGEDFETQFEKALLNLPEAQDTNSLFQKSPLQHPSVDHIDFAKESKLGYNDKISLIKG